MPACLFEPELNSISTLKRVINYRLTRSSKRRKTMQISIRPPGQVDISAPVSYSISMIEGFLIRKSGWIIKKLDIFKTRESLKIQKQSDALTCLYLGREYPVAWRNSKETWGRIYFDESGWSVDVPVNIDGQHRADYTANFLIKWYKSRAKSVLEERVAKYADILKVSPSQVRVRSPKRLWGSCHPSKRVLHFNWKIIMAPLETVDYVVIHELSHIKVPSHSKRFWALVHEFCPRYKTHSDWLKVNGHRFELPFRG